MRQRVITAIVALVFFIPIIYLGGVYIDALSVLLAVIGMSEIFIMRKRIIVSVDFIIATLAVVTLALPDAFFKDIWAPDGRLKIFFVLMMVLLIYTVLSKNKFTFEDAGVIALSSIYIGVGFRFLAGVRNTDHGLALLGFILVTIWSTDIGAYMIGRVIGKHKLWPAISPNKTWEGSLGGLAAAVILSTVYLLIFKTGRPINLLIPYAFLISVMGQMGDLVESAYKRYFGVKDSGKILPGHGGILDRFDSLLFTLPLIYLLGLL